MSWQTDILPYHIYVISHKYGFTRDLLVKNTADFFAVTESKIDSSFTNAQFHVPVYVMHLQDLSTSIGGLLVCVRGDVPHRRVKLSEINSGHTYLTILNGFIVC